MIVGAMKFDAPPWLSALHDDSKVNHKASFLRTIFAVRATFCVGLLYPMMWSPIAVAQSVARQSENIATCSSLATASSEAESLIATVLGPLDDNLETNDGRAATFGDSARQKLPRSHQQSALCSPNLSGRNNRNTATGTSITNIGYGDSSARGTVEFEPFRAGFGSDERPERGRRTRQKTTIAEMQLQIAGSRGPSVPLPTTSHMMFEAAQEQSVLVSDPRSSRRALQSAANSQVACYSRVP